MDIAWDEIVTALEEWRTGLDDPSVTTVAEIYSHSPWSVLLSTIISLRTKDEVTVVVSKRLLEKAPTPERFLALGEAEAVKLAYPAGFYKTKVKNLRSIATILLDEYGGKVPADMEALLALPGVGRKTANLVLIEAFDQDGICVDTHVHRISNRLGVLQSKNTEETEMTLREILPRQYWKRINPLLVLYGQRQCRPISPICSSCVIAGHCKKAGVGKTR
jgi:endonuclease-3